MVANSVGKSAAVAHRVPHWLLFQRVLLTTGSANWGNGAQTLRPSFTMALQQTGPRFAKKITSAIFSASSSPRTHTLSGQRARTIESFCGGFHLSTSSLTKVCRCFVHFYSRETRTSQQTHCFCFTLGRPGHCIKNPDAARTQRLMSLRSDHSLLLSGTPVQNNVNELMCVHQSLRRFVF